MTPTEFLDSIKERARQLNRHIVYPDATDERAIRAARIVTDEGIARMTLVGDEKSIRAKASAIDIPLAGIDVADPAVSPQTKEFADTFYELRKHKGIQPAEAAATVRQPLYFGAMMVRSYLAHGSVAGSLSTTGDVIRAGILCIGLQDGIQTVSSFFLMVFPEAVYGFADCAVLPDPTADQLADIAIVTSDNYRRLLETPARTAMLSFSTKGSAEHDLVGKVQEALTLARQKRADLQIDGELQFDAAVVPEIGKRKAPGSIIAGNANVLIFPDLNSGNIAYKIAQRWGGAEAIGPIVQGLKKPAFDLSRGCSVEDIVSVTAFNAVMS